MEMAEDVEINKKRERDWRSLFFIQLVKADLQSADCEYEDL